MFGAAWQGDSAMGELTTIGFKPGASSLHRLDPRTKQLLIMILSVACFGAGVVFLTIFSIMLIVLFHLSSLRFIQFLREIRYFLFFLLFIFAVRVLSFSDDLLPVIEAATVKEAALVCWRLLLVVLMGVLLISTTRTADIRASLIWFMKPLPFVNERIAATMVGLVVRLLPLVLFQAQELGDVMRARGIEKRKNPLLRLITFTIALFRRVFLRADGLADTMQARCYNEYRTLPELSFTRDDLIAATVSIVVLLTAFVP